MSEMLQSPSSKSSRILYQCLHLFGTNVSLCYEVIMCNQRVFTYGFMLFKAFHLNALPPAYEALNHLQSASLSVNETNSWTFHQDITYIYIDRDNNMTMFISMSLWTNLIHPPPIKKHCFSKSAKRHRFPPDSWHPVLKLWSPTNMNTANTINTMQPYNTSSKQKNKWVQEEWIRIRI